MRPSLTMLEPALIDGIVDEALRIRREDFHDLLADHVELMSALGGSPGPWLQPLLETLLREAARGAVENAPAALIARARALNRA